VRIATYQFRTSRPFLQFHVVRRNGTVALNYDDSIRVTK
jgi:hypothetical protein